LREDGIEWIEFMTTIDRTFVPTTRSISLLRSAYSSSTVARRRGAERFHFQTVIPVVHFWP
jgi:hypothetical protein